jgi:GH35 family endo-1,4-beta-xylanase
MNLLTNSVVKLQQRPFIANNFPKPSNALTALLLICMIYTYASKVTAESDDYLFSGDDTKGIEKITITASHSIEKWRLEANQRINKFRKADLTIKVVDKETGKPVTNADITLKFKKHHFRFGGIISAPEFKNEAYKKLFLNMGFNASGFNNALKYKLGKYFKKYKAENIIKWFRKNKIFVRGHCLVWPGDEKGSHLPQELAELTTNYNNSPSDSLKKIISSETIQMIRNGASRWDVDEWDVINEPRGNHLIQDIVGNKIETEAEWFKCAAENVKNKNITLYLNENRVISDPAKPDSAFTDKLKCYYDNLQALLKAKAPVSGLGFQSRFAKLLPPETIIARLNAFNEFNLPIAATEMEMKKTIETEYDKALMTERVMTLYFSHPLVNGIYAWTILNLENGKFNRGLINPDYTPNLRGKIWLYLTKKLWTTNLNVKTDKNGIVKIRAFKGEYDLKAKDKSKKKSISLELEKDSIITVRI